MIVAHDQNRGIGIRNGLPWRLQGDMKYFRKVTIGAKNNAVIMGRKTWDSVPEKFRPLSDRVNIVLTRNPNQQYPEAVIVCASLDEALAAAEEKKVDNIFLLGGSQIYELGLEHGHCKSLYITELMTTFDCDAFFPVYKERFRLIDQSASQEENGIPYIWNVYEKSK